MWLSKLNYSVFRQPGTTNSVAQTKLSTVGKFCTGPFVSFYSPPADNYLSLSGPIENNGDLWFVILKNRTLLQIAQFVLVQRSIRRSMDDVWPRFIVDRGG